MLVLSCVPQVLASVYKEKALGETQVDVVYMNGWIAVYQFMVCLPLAIPSAWASHLSLEQLPQNVIDGAKCYMGINSVFDATPLVPADDCSTSFVYVTIYLGFNLLYNILLIMILKYGSANILWLAMTIMVPLGNVVFSLDFVPGHQPLKSTDVWGLTVIMAGLVQYRFADKFKMKFIQHKRSVRFVEDEDGNRAASHGARYVGVNGIEVRCSVVPILMLLDRARAPHRHVPQNASGLFPKEPVPDSLHIHVKIGLYTIATSTIAAHAATTFH